MRIRWDIPVRQKTSFQELSGEVVLANELADHGVSAGKLAESRPRRRGELAAKEFCIGELADQGFCTGELADQGVHDLYGKEVSSRQVCRPQKLYQQAGRTENLFRRVG